MRMLAVLITVIWAASLSFAEVVNFDKARVGSPPPGWIATQTGTGEAQWTVEKDDTAPSKPNVLKQSGQATYPVCIKDDRSIKDGFVEVKFKPISGKTDQAGGLVWRAKDSNNYYIARANALEDNVTIYDIVSGRRTERKRTNMNVASNQWHTLRVDFQGNHFRVTLDGNKAIEWDDATFTEAGKVGVWTKADSVTLFDDFTVEALNSANRSSPTGKTLAQKLVDDLAKKYPDLVRIGLHLTPPGTSDNIIVASNIPAKIGQKSDPEDLKAMEAGKTVVLKEGDNFDVTLPLHDAAGRAIGAIGLTFPPRQGESEVEVLKRANTIAHEFEQQIPSKESLLQ
jgi:3-keto-disaccharide hydrolase